MIWFTEITEYISSSVSNKHLTGVIEVGDTADCYWETSAGTRDDVIRHDGVLKKLSCKHQV